MLRGFASATAPKSWSQLLPSIVHLEYKERTAARVFEVSVLIADESSGELCKSNPKKSDLFIDQIKRKECQKKPILMDTLYQ